MITTTPSVLIKISTNDGEARRCTHQCGDPIQFRIPEFDFESKSVPKTTSASN
jgi:hypothetical protein